MTHRFVKVGLLDHLGYGNLGDDGTVVAVKHQIERRWPNAEIIALSLNPLDTEQRLGIPSWQIRRTIPSAGAYIPQAPSTTLRARIKRHLSRHHLLFRTIQATKATLFDAPRDFFKETLFLFRSYRVARTLDILVICGGGQLLDSWGGPWKFPYTLFKWVVLGKLGGAKCYVINVGAGPLDKRLSRWFIRNALLLSDYVSFRDWKSSKLIHEIGFARLAPAIADCVYALPISRSSAVGGNLNGRQLTIAVSPMAFYDPSRYFKGDQSVYALYITKLAQFCATLVRKKYHLQLLSTELWFDLGAIADVKKATLELLGDETSSSIVATQVNDISGLLKQLLQVDIVVTCRFHGVVYAHLMNVPVLAIAHHPKVSAAMDEFGLSEYCLDIHDFSPETLVSTLENLLANADNIRADVPQRVARCQKALSGQFDELFPMHDERVLEAEPQLLRQ